MTIFVGVKDGKIFTRDSKTKNYQYVVIGKQDIHSGLTDAPDEWHAVNWCGRFDLAEKKAKACKDFWHVEILPVFEKSSKEDAARQAAYEVAMKAHAEKDAEDRKRDRTEYFKKIEEEAARQAPEREDADEAARMEAYYNAKREEEQARFKGQDEADTEAWLKTLAEEPEPEGLLIRPYEEDDYVPPVWEGEEEREEAPAAEEENGSIVFRQTFEPPLVFYEGDGLKIDIYNPEKYEIIRKEPSTQAEPTGYAPSLICKACGRILTGPESIARGYGDKCWRKVWKFVKGKEEPQAPADQKANNPASVTDPDTAFRTRLEIKRRIDCSEETCLCGEKIEGAPVYFYDHAGGYMIPGYSQPQWIYAVCPKCGWQFSLRKMHTVDIEDLETEGRREAGVRLAEEEAAKAARKAKALEAMK